MLVARQRSKAVIDRYATSKRLKLCHVTGRPRSSAQRPKVLIPRRARRQQPAGKELPCIGFTGLAGFFFLELLNFEF